MDIWELIHQMEDLFVFVFVVVVEVLVSVGIEEFCNKNKIIFFKMEILVANIPAIRCSLLIIRKSKSASY